jgi:hypothetical protein
MKKLTLTKSLFAVGAILQRCSASNPGVVRLGNDQYMLTRQAASGFHGLGPMKIDALREAENHWIVLGQTILVTNTIDSIPPYVLGNRQTTEITFRCI